jgi:hypothetical protein
MIVHEKDLVKFQGCKAFPHRMVFSTPLSTGVFEEISFWEDFENFVASQGLTGTCESQSAYEILESLLRSILDINLFSPDIQLNPYPTHKDAFENEFPSERYSPENGLPLGASFRSMIRNEILPPDTELVFLPRNVTALVESLKVTPLQVGFSVHDGWTSDRITINGEILSPLRIPPANGHAVKLPRTTSGIAGEPMIVIKNTWGIDWGFRGFAQMNLPLFFSSLIAPVLMLRIKSPRWFLTNRKFEKLFITSEQFRQITSRLSAGDLSDLAA